MMQRRQLLAAAWTLPLPGMARAEPAAPAGDDWFIFLETGKPTPPDQEAVQAMQRGHIANFERLFAAGKLFAAGPMRDPARVKRGIVVVRAATREQLQDYFRPDDYVREGYMTVNAIRAQVRRALHTDGIERTGIVEGRIVLLGRGGGAAGTSFLQELLDRGRIGAWYTLLDGPLAEVLFVPGTDSAAIEAELRDYPGVAEQRVSLAVWPQWFSKGVLR